ncbi:MAG: hypothetical protein AAFX50_16640, partial [Acidobacteriota bacterium]
RRVLGDRGPSFSAALSAVPVAGAVAAAVRAAHDGVESYPDLVGSRLALLNGAKGPDYSLVFGGLVAYVLALVVAHLVSRFVGHRLGDGAVTTTARHSLYACVPFALWLSMSMVRPAPAVVLVWLSASCVVSVWVLHLVLSVLGGRDGEDAASPALADAMLAGPWLAAGGVLTGLTGVLRVAPRVDVASPVAWAAAAGVATAAVAALVWTRPKGTRAVTAQRLCLLAQVPYPLGFLLLAPPWLREESGLMPGVAAGPALWLLVAGLMALSWGQLGRRLFGASPRGPFAPLALGTLTFLWRMPRVAEASLAGDDFHSGEVLLPWQQWADFGKIPFVDYLPTHGLADVVPGLLIDVFFDGTAASLQSSFGLRAALVVLVAYLALRVHVGAPASLAVVFLMPSNLRFEIFGVAWALLLWFSSPQMLDRPRRWLLAYGLVAPAFFLYAPGQGSLWIVATMPVAAWVAWGGRSEIGRPGLRTVAGAAAGLALVGFATPAVAMVIGAARYLLDL